MSIKDCGRGGSLHKIPSETYIALYWLGCSWWSQDILYNSCNTCLLFLSPLAPNPAWHILLNMILRMRGVTSHKKHFLPKCFTVVGTQAIWFTLLGRGVVPEMKCESVMKNMITDVWLVFPWPRSHNTICEDTCPWFVCFLTPCVYPYYMPFFPLNPLVGIITPDVKIILAVSKSFQ